MDPAVMKSFSPTPPPWTDQAVHAFEFCCPTCHLSSLEAQAAWINRRAPVYHDDYRRKWQEFYHCTCGTVWWAWSSDRPPSLLNASADMDTDLDLPDQPLEDPLEEL